MSTQANIEKMVQSYLAELSFFAFKFYGDKRVIVNFFGHIDVVDVMVFTGDKHVAFHDSFNIRKQGAFESLVVVIDYLKSIEVKDV